MQFHPRATARTWQQMYWALSVLPIPEVQAAMETANGNTHTLVWLWYNEQVYDADGDTGDNQVAWEVIQQVTARLPPPPRGPPTLRGLIVNPPDDEDVKNEEDPVMECVVCSDQPANMVIQPCCHQVICAKCADEWFIRARCPTCNGDIVPGCVVYVRTRTQHVAIPNG
jgi:hypothetical protein